MKGIRSPLIVAIASLAVGLVAGTVVAKTQDEEQKTQYLVIEEFGIAPDMSMDEGIARLSGWVRALRATGKHSSVRLFLHDWGPEAALYVVSETSDWGAVGTIFADVIAAEPDLMKKPLGFAGHSDNILTEVPVE